MKVQAMNHFVLLRRDNPEEKVGSIVIPGTAQKVTNRGTVISAGPGEYHGTNGVFQECTLKPGDRVLFDLYAFHEVELEVDKKRGKEKLAFVPLHNIQGKILEE